MWETYSVLHGNSEDGAKPPSLYASFQPKAHEITLLSPSLACRPQSNPTATKHHSCLYSIVFPILFYPVPPVDLDQVQRQQNAIPIFHYCCSRALLPSPASRPWTNPTAAKRHPYLLVLLFLSSFTKCLTYCDLCLKPSNSEFYDTVNSSLWFG